VHGEGSSIEEVEDAFRKGNMEVVNEVVAKPAYYGRYYHSLAIVAVSYGQIDIVRPHIAKDMKSNVSEHADKFAMLLRAHWNSEANNRRRSGRED
jgi:hypothetical protein